jgi:hypothetical protein
MEPHDTLQLDDTVKTIGKPTYSGTVPIGTCGTVIRVRERYVGTVYEYRQYKVTFSDYSDGDDLTNLYEEFNLMSLDY